MKLGKIYSQAMTVDNMHVSKVAAFILISLGLFQVFYAKGLSRENEQIKILGWVTLGIGVAYFIFTLVSGIRLIMK